MSDWRQNDEMEIAEFRRMFPLRRIPGVIGPLFFSGLLFIFIGAVISGKHVKREDLITISSLLLALIFAGIYGLRKSAFYDYYWRTDSRGLTVHGAGRRMHLPWSEVTYAKTQYAGFRQGVRHVIRTSSIVVQVPLQADKLVRSIKYHLSRDGKGDGIDV